MGVIAWLLLIGLTLGPWNAGSSHQRSGERTPSSEEELTSSRGLPRHL
jgi:hypothetical protein